MRFITLTLLCFSLTLSSCKKEDACSSEIQLSATSTTPTVGESFTITASPDNDNDQYAWHGPRDFSGENESSIIIANPTYLDRGWYHAAKSNVSCGETIYDSVFIDVKLRQGVAPCTPPNNSISGSTIPTSNFNTVIKTFDVSFNGKSLFGSASPGYPSSFRVLFNPNNGNVEPIDGIYTTTNVIAFSQVDPYIWVSLSFRYNNEFYHSHAGRDVFVSHINGKLSATFCAVPFSNGTNIITVTGKLTEN